MKHILIVDDAYDLARMLQEALRAAHPEISATVVPSGEEAFLESMRMAVDLLVTDSFAWDKRARPDPENSRPPAARESDFDFWPLYG